jgi:beta-glucanase (GH16 family)
MLSPSIIATRIRSTLLLLSALWLASCGGVSSGVPEGEFVPAVVAWNLVFEDNFDGTALDTGVWNVDEGDGCPDLCGWGNNELQIYSASNIEVSGGTLKLRGQQESDSSYTSARVNTRGKFDFTYGKVEVRARIPAGMGTWPAVWLLHSNPSIYGPWPLSGEIDIMEGFNYGPLNSVIRSTTHYGLPIEPYDGTGGAGMKNGVTMTPNADMQFFTYGVEWEGGRLRFFIDTDSLQDRNGALIGNGHFQTQTVDEYYAYYPSDPDGFYDPLGPLTYGLSDAPFDQAFHLIMNFAIGGNPVGNPDMNTIFPQALEIDYVRVYECENSNPETKRGCGSIDASIVPLKDLQGSRLENQTTAKPYVEVLDLYLDAPELITVNIGTDIGTNQLQVGGFTGPGATVTSNVAAADPDDPANTVWAVNISGDVANVFLGSEDKSGDAILDTGFDFSGSGLGGDPGGEVVFDMYVNSFTPGTDLFIKLDSGFPNLGEVRIDEADLAIGAWKTYSVKLKDLVENPGFVVCCSGQGVDLENVLNPFVLEVANGAADVLLDNIRATNACYVVGACGVGAITRGIPDFVVFDDAVNTQAWDTGIAAADSGSGFVNYVVPNDPNNKANWEIIDDVDPLRGQVIDVTFNDSGEFGVWFIQSTSAVNMSAYSAGAVTFDIIVDDYGSNTTGMTMKIDCFFPCTSGDKSLGVIADGVWETVTVPVSSLTGSGLDLTSVNTGVVIFPTAQTGAIRYRLDDIRWTAETDAPPLAQIDLPVTFEDPTVNYTVVDFEGQGTGLITDPADANNTVASTTKGVGAQTFAGTVIGTGAGFANPIAFTAGETRMSINVFAPASGIPILLRVENDDNSTGFEVIANTTTANTWETITFDFGTVGINLNATYVRAIVFFDFGQVGADTNFLWDNVVLGGGGGGGPPSGTQVDLPVTFDDGAVDYDLVDFGDPASAATTIVMDPDNMSNMVASTNKPLGSPLWAGTTVGGTNGLANAIPFTATDTTMTIRVYSPDAGIPVRLKVEDQTDPTISVETEAMTTIAGSWETLTFDFSVQAPGTAALNPASTYDKASVFFNFGTDGATAGDKTYLWDDVVFAGGGGGGPGSSISLPVTFEDSGVNYELQDFGGVGTTMPFVDPTDANNTVASSNKPLGAELWGGTTVADVSGFDMALPFTATDTTMTVRVYSPDAGIPVLLKVEDKTNGAISVETTAMTTTANAWETLTFDFANQSAGTPALDLNATYDKASIFFNFGTDGNTAGDKTYLWDDVTFVSAGGGGGTQVALPVTFEDTNIVYELQDFGGVVTTMPFVDPVVGANTVASSNKPPGAEVWGGTTVADVSGFVDAVPFTASDTIMTVRVYSPDAGIPVLLKVEDKTNGAISVETTALTTMVNTWETLSFNFSNEAAGTPALALGATYDKASIFFNFGTDGNTAGDKTYLWDDVTFAAGAGGGAGGGGGSSLELPVTFNDGGTVYTLTDFGDAMSTLVADPTNGANTVASTIKPVTAPLWAGTTVGGDSGFGTPIPFSAMNTTMTVRVYSPDAGITVRLKVEDKTDVTVTVETDAMTTVANGWETLTFDFDNEAPGTAQLNLAQTYDKASIFFNFGVDGATVGVPKTYLWDDMEWAP